MLKCGGSLGILCLALAWSVPARAQLPLPQLTNPPGFQLASADALVDETRTLSQTLSRTLEDRRQAREALGAGDAPESSPATRRLFELHDEEIETLADALNEAQSALNAASAPAAGSDGPADLEAVLEARRRRDHMERQAEIRTQLADRLETVVGDEPPVPGREAPADARIEYQSWRVQVAQSQRARAKALRTSIEARQAQRDLERAEARLSVTDADVARARAALAEVLAEVEAERRELARAKEALAQSRPEARGAAGEDVTVWEAVRRRAQRLSLARYDLIARKEKNLQARLRQARARVLVAEALSERKVLTMPTGLTEGEIAAELAGVEELASGVQLELVELQREEPDPKQKRLRRLWSQHREVLQDTQVVLQDTQTHLRAIQRMRTIGQAERPLWRPILSFWTTVLLSIVLLAGAYVLLRWVGPRFLASLEDEASVLGRRVPTAMRTQFATVLSILWPVTVLASAAALLLWNLWGLAMGPLEVVRIVDRPLFYLEQTPVSAFSFLQLLLVLWITYVLSRSLRRFLNQRLLSQLGLDRGQANAIATFAYYLAILTGLIIGLNLVGIGFSSLAVVLGVLGLGIGFGLRTITENFISGLIILAERPIQVGDWIDIDGEVEGQVGSIQARSTTVRTRDNISVIIPNSDFVVKPVTNWSHGDPKVRLGIKVGVAYGSDSDLVRKTLLDVAQRHGQVLRKPAPEVQFRAFGDSSLQFLLLVWVEEQMHRFRIASDLHFAIDKAFRKVGIVIAFPQMDVHFSSVSASVRQAMAAILAGDAREAPPPTSSRESSPTLRIPTSKTKIRDAQTEPSGPVAVDEDA